MKTLRIQLRVPAERARLAEVNAAIAATLLEAGAAPSLVDDVQLIAEEMLCNTFDHGFASGCEGEATFDLAFDGERLVLRFIDDGMQYDPLSCPVPDLDADIEDRPIGGLGIHLIRTLAQEMDYEWRDGRNHLHVVLGAALPNTDQGNPS